MKKILIVILVILMTIAMAACGGSASDSGGGMADESGNTNSYGGFGNSFMVRDSEPAEAAEEYDGSSSSGGDGSKESGAISIGLPASLAKDKVKLIFYADVSVQTLDFDEAVKGLYQLTEKFGGYFESISSDNGNYYAEDDTYKYGYYTVRVPSEKYQQFISSISEGMHVVNMNQRAQDVGQEYFETERRLETLKNKHDRLEELLKKATKMSDIIELESALSDTEYEIEQYASDLQRYDSLVSYSTVNVSIEKVSEFSQGIQEELSFGERLLRSIRQGAANFGWWIGDLINWIGYNIIQLAILAVIIIALARFNVIRKIGGLFGSKKKDYVIVSKKDGTAAEEGKDK